MFPILHFEWNESAASLSEIIRPFGNLVKNRQQYIIQYSNSNKTLSSNAVIETTVHPTGYELFYDGTLLLKRVRMNIKTKRNDQEFIYEMIYISKGFKVVFNISINSDQMLFTFSKGVEHYRIFAAKIDEKWNFGYRCPQSSEDIINGMFITSSSILQGFININIPEVGPEWSGEAMLEQLSNGGRISLNLGTNATSFKATWSSTNTTYQLTSQAAQSDLESFLHLDLNSHYSNSVWLLDLDIASPFFNWRWTTHMAKSNQSNQRSIELTSQANYFQQPISQPITYLLGYKENNTSRLLDLRHNISSELYHFEGNLTVDCHSTGEIITAIDQRAASPLSQLFHLELKQIFHQMATSFRETVVMNTGLVDMHVTGRWEQSIFHFYRKQFVFHSLVEELLPSATINLHYSDNRQFLHEILFPFLARKSVVLINWEDSIQRLSLSHQDLFLSNETANILEIIMFKSELGQNVKIVSDAKFDHFLYQLTSQVSKIHKHLLLVCENVHHPLNQLFKPLLKRPSICQFWNDIPMLSYSLFPEISLVYKLMNL